MLKIYLSQINTIVGDLDGNVSKVLDEYKIASEAGCDLAIFCEMTITGYPAEDLWLKKHFIEKSNEKIVEIISATKSSKCAILVGAPSVAINRAKKEIISNSAFLIENGEVKKIIRKKTLPNYGVFDERRYFEPEAALSFVEFRGQTLAIMICEDIWDDKNIYLLQEQIFDAVISINSSPYSANKQKRRDDVVKNIVLQTKKPFIYVNQVGGQDALVFDGSSFVMDESGNKVIKMKDFAKDSAIFELEKGFVAKYDAQQKITLQQNIAASNYNACILGLRDYVGKNNFQKIILGMSGGIDSALVATMAVDALGFENVELYALPSRYNSETSMTDAQNCAKNLECELQVVSIEPMIDAMSFSISNILTAKSKNESAVNLAKENIQARIRGNILMAISNASDALLLSTGNKSELATGYATLYGDMCGAFNPLKDLYKTQVYELANWRNCNIPEISVYKKTELIPQNIINKPPTAELRPNQKDSDSLPDYETLDKILFALIEERKSVENIINSGLDGNLVKKVAKLLQNSEYKRRQAVIGPKISDMSFDKDWRYPMANKFWQ